ncbi:endonuclease/exonuclease/phosphatase family protein [Shinella sp. BYT-45]|uniref:endonuclease/exonuclease/phosphatase family protein n=1 Tax=Shinella sp. BYT-45 TaxID=3377377 RepID=UPI00398116AD
MRTPKDEGGAGVPSKDSDTTLLLATWNLRDFGRKGARGHGERTLEALYYIAAFISAFDLVAVQEVNDDLDLFNTLKRILGRDWDFIATDTSPGKPGNDERMVFLFDTRKVRFRSIAGEITLLEDELIRLNEQRAEIPPGGKLILADGTESDIPPGAVLKLPDGSKILSGQQFVRTPFLVSFQAGWFKFNLCTVHMLYGEGRAGLEQRTREIAQIARVFQSRAAAERRRNKEKKRDEDANEAYIVLGDFNIEKVGHATMNALLDNGFAMAEELQNAPTNMFQTKHYDQIAVLKGHGVVRQRKGLAGVLDVFQVVFRASSDDVAVLKPRDRAKLPLAGASDFDAYFDQMGESAMRDRHDKRRSFDNGVSVNAGDPRTREQAREWYASAWRTYQMSDHLPMWTALEIDFRTEYLKKTEQEALARLGPQA